MILPEKSKFMGIDLPQGWKKAVELITEEKLRRVLVLGEVDAGKSTFASYLLKKLLEARLTCSLVDADVGQKDLGPPSTVALGTFKSLEELSLRKVSALYFVGSTSPPGHLLPIIAGTKLLADRAEGITVINTTGFVKDAGAALKSFKIEILKPDVLVALQRSAELEPLLQSYSHVRCLRLPVSPNAKFRGHEERRALRREAFRRYFSSAEERELKAEEVRFQRRSESALSPNLLVGLADYENEVLGLGIVKSFNGATLTLLTPVKGDIGVVQLGSILVREDGEELGSTSPPARR